MERIVARLGSGIIIGADAATTTLLEKQTTHQPFKKIKYSAKEKEKLKRLAEQSQERSLSPDELLEWLKLAKRVLIPLLRIAKVFTPKHIDDVIDALISSLQERSEI